MYEIKGQEEKRISTLHIFSKAKKICQQKIYARWLAKAVLTVASYDSYEWMSYNIVSFYTKPTPSIVPIAQKKERTKKQKENNKGERKSKPLAVLAEIEIKD